jgi:predicted TIM-barrel fold metal-dependent hydrolase
MHEHWTFDYQDRIFPVPVIALNIVDRGIAELDWVLERGARAILIRPAPVPGLMGRRSMALPEFDPFWKRVAEADIFVGMHGSDSGYQRYYNDWEGKRNEFTPFKAGTAFGSIMTRQHRPMVDTVSSLIGHGLCSRFPQLKIAPVESGSAWVRHLLEDMAYVYSMAPQEFDEDPVEVFKRNIYVHPFHEEDTVGLVKLLGSDRVLFGSDYPHPEGMADPITFVDELGDLDDQAVRNVMGANLARLMRVEDAA